MNNRCGTCPVCGGWLEVVDEATGWIVCDTCDYEKQYGEVIKNDERS